MKLIYLLIFSLALASCTSSLEKNTETSTPSISWNSSSSSGGENIETVSNPEVQEPLRNDLPWAPEEYTFLFDESMQEEVAISFLSWDEVKIFFINSEASSMKVNIDFQDEPGNFRLSQVIAPDGSSDGPFGVETDYKLWQLWGYQLIFSESNMIGEPWEWEAIIRIALEK